MKQLHLAPFQREILERMREAGFQFVVNFTAGETYFLKKNYDELFGIPGSDVKILDYLEFDEYQFLPEELSCFEMIEGAKEPTRIDDLLSADAGTARYGEWFSVKTPPEKYEDEYDEPILFYVWVDGLGEPYKAFFDGNMWWDGISEIDGVTHWMPLPKPPATDNNVGTKKEEESE